MEKCGVIEMKRRGGQSDGGWTGRHWVVSVHHITNGLWWKKEGDGGREDWSKDALLGIKS